MLFLLSIFPLIDQMAATLCSPQNSMQCLPGWMCKNFTFPFGVLESIEWTPNEFWLCINGKPLDGHEEGYDLRGSLSKQCNHTNFFSKQIDERIINQKDFIHFTPPPFDGQEWRLSPEMIRQDLLFLMMVKSVLEEDVSESFIECISQHRTRSDELREIGLTPISGMPSTREKRHRKEESVETKLWSFLCRSDQECPPREICEKELNIHKLFTRFNLRRWKTIGFCRPVTAINSDSDSFCAPKTALALQNLAFFSGNREIAEYDLEGRIVENFALNEEILLYGGHHLKSILFTKAFEIHSSCVRSVA